MASSAGALEPHKKKGGAKKPQNVADKVPRSSSRRARGRELIEEEKTPVTKELVLSPLDTANNHFPLRFLSCWV
jgi:hypothetical protein